MFWTRRTLLKLLSDLEITYNKSVLYLLILYDYRACLKIKYGLPLLEHQSR